MTILRSLSLSLIGLSMAVGACSSDDEPIGEPTSTTVVDLAIASGDFDILVSALSRTGLDASLSGDGPFTVLAPTDAAFERLPDGLLESLDDETLARILTYHVVAANALAADVVQLDAATSLEGSDIGIRVADGAVMLNGITQVIDTDIVADNGVIHVVDSVMLPPDMAFPGTIVDAAIAYPVFDALVSAAVTADLAGALAGDNDGAGLTLFAPTNKAFAALGVDMAELAVDDLSDILLYHVLGATVDAATASSLTTADTLQGSAIDIALADDEVVLNGDIKVVQTDLRVENGIIHIVDGVLVPAQ